MAEFDMDDRRGSEVRSSSRRHHGEGGGRGDRGSRRSRRENSRSRSRSRSRSPDSHRHRSSRRPSSRRGSKHHRRSSRSDDDDSSSSSSRSDSRSPTLAAKPSGLLPSSSSSSVGGVAGGALPQITTMNPYVGGGGLQQQQQAMPLFSAGLVTGGYTLPQQQQQQQQQQQLTPQDKINRELFVGNVPPGTSEALLMQFLNGAMRRVGLCGPADTPIVNCRTNSKFAFIEITSQEMAAVTLNLNGIPFLGASLRVSRPSKYAGPMTPSQTWQQLTGQPLPPGMTPVPENPSGNVIGPGGVVVMNCTPEEKLQRELFVGNTTPEMTESMLKDFLGRALEQVGLTIMPGNPILACRVSGKFAFVELRSKEEAANALNLNNIPYLGAQLRVGRPSKYTGPLTPHGNWEDILAKFICGELQLGGGGGMQQMQQQQMQQAAPIAAATTAYAPFATALVPVALAVKQPTTVVELKQMLTLKELIDDTEYEEILEDTRDECTPFGTLKNVIIPRTGPGATKIFLEYMTVEDAGRAIAGLAGRTFDGRKVEAVYFDPVKFANQDYSD